MEKAQEGKVEKSTSEPEAIEPVEKLAVGSLKIREVDREWLEGEQLRLRTKERKKITQAELFSRMRAAYKAATPATLGNPPGSNPNFPVLDGNSPPVVGVESLMSQLNSIQQQIKDLSQQYNGLRLQNEQFLQRLKPRGKTTSSRLGKSAKDVDAKRKAKAVIAEAEKRRRRSLMDHEGGGGAGEVEKKPGTRPTRGARRIEGSG